jgi:hypothetical protein
MKSYEIHLKTAHLLDDFVELLLGLSNGVLLDLSVLWHRSSTTFQNKVLFPTDGYTKLTTIL